MSESGQTRPVACATLRVAGNHAKHILRSQDVQNRRLRAWNARWRGCPAWLAAPGVATAYVGRVDASRHDERIKSDRFGSGPGYASLDAAEIVGSNGEVVGVERAAHFLSFAQRQVERRQTSNSRRTADLNQVSQEWADAVQSEFAALSANPNAIMITPMVMEIIAEKAGTPLA
jgi:Protein-L-isoaspartate(D-aspartate) O-methyltransferase (PCMT)